MKTFHIDPANIFFMLLNSNTDILTKNQELKFLTAISFPAFSGLLAKLIAAAAAAPDEMPT